MPAITHYKFPNGKTWPVDDDGTITATIELSFDSLIGMGIDAMNDFACEDITGSFEMQGISYKPLSLTGDNITIQVEGDVTEMLENNEEVKVVEPSKVLA